MTTRRRLVAAAAAIGLVAVAGTNHGVRAAGAETARADVTMLASPRLEGRLAGTVGERNAAEYLVTRLRQIGALPLPGQSDYRLPFSFTAGTHDGGSRLRVMAATGAALADATADARPDGARALSFSDNGDVTGPVVFAGYGIVVPESQGFSYDSYATLDVKDKIVLVLRYFPEDADPQAKAVLARYSDLRYKALAARQHGARALVVVTGPRSPNAGELVPMTFDTALSGSGIVAASVTGSVADAMFRAFADPGKTLASAQLALDSANPHVAGFELPVSVTVHAAVEREQRTGYNLGAYLPATAPATSLDKPWIALGAHYDHLGHGENGNSLAGNDERGGLHGGADDNASGTAALLSAAETLAREPRRRHILLALWSGEELGLLGSAAFTATPAVPIDQLEAYLNFDMVGRMHDNKLTVQAAGSSPAWARVIEQANVAAGFDLQVQDDPYQPTDVANFNQAGVPCLNFFTGTHTDYHRPTDTPDKIAYEDLARVADFAVAITRRLLTLDQAPAFAKVEPKTTAGGRAEVRVFTGTIPDYSTEVKGLLLSGVVGGGPAERAGLQKGDVIVEIGGQTISNIYDYTYALDVLKIGQPSTLVYMRGGARRTTTLTPAARK